MLKADDALKGVAIIFFHRYNVWIIYKYIVGRKYKF